MSKKATNRLIDHKFLSSRVSSEFGKQKWIIFCETMMHYGFTLRLYEARKTYSKYVTVLDAGKEFKVRFSNHRPIYRREVNGDCDFFVGRTNLGVTTTGDAIEATLKHFQRMI